MVSSRAFATLLEPGDNTLTETTSVSTSSYSDVRYVAIRRFLLEEKSLEGKLKRQTWKQEDHGYTSYRKLIMEMKRNRVAKEKQEKKKQQDEKGEGKSQEVSDTEREIEKEEGRLAMPRSRRPSEISPTPASAVSLLRESVSTPSPKRIVGAMSPVSLDRAMTTGNGLVKDLQMQRRDLGTDAMDIAVTEVYCIFSDCKASVSCIKFGHGSLDLLAYGASDGTLRVCLVSQPPRTLHSLQGHTKEITDFDWSQSNSYLCSSSLDKSVRVWDVDNGTCLRIIYGQAAQLAIRFHPVNNNFMLVGSTNNELTVLNFSTGRVNHKLSLESRVTAMDVEPSGKVLFAGDNLGYVHSIKLDSPPIHAHRNTSGLARSAPVTSLHFKGHSIIAGGPVLLAFSLDGTLRFFSAAMEVDGYLSLKCSLQLTPRTRSSRASFCPATDKGELIVTGSDDHYIYFYNFANVKHPLSGRLQGHGAPVVDMAWNCGDNMMASADCEGFVYVWKKAEE